MREDCDGALLRSQELQKEQIQPKQQHMFFDLVPIARKIITNTTSIDGCEMQNVTNVVNWDMQKRYAKLKILKKF